jgi:hypothetical protein
MQKGKSGKPNLWNCLRPFSSAPEKTQNLEKIYKNRTEKNGHGEYVAGML